MQNVGIRLAYGMGYGAILDVASVDIKILTVRPAARVGGAGNDAPQGNQAVFQFGAKALFGEFDPPNVADAFRSIGGTPLLLRLGVGKPAKRSEERRVWQGWSGSGHLEWSASPKKQKEI